MQHILRFNVGDLSLRSNRAVEIVGIAGLPNSDARCITIGGLPLFMNPELVRLTDSQSPDTTRITVGRLLQSLGSYAWKASHVHV